MTRLVAATACAAFVASFVGCQSIGRMNVVGSGNVETEDRDVSAFQKIDLAGSGELILSQGDRNEISIEADDNLLPFLITENDDDTLRISVKDGVALYPSKPIRFHVTVKTIEAIGFSGSGSVTVDQFSTDKLTVNISGSADVVFRDITAKDLKCTISGSGSVTAGGIVKNFSATVSGSGEVKTDALETQSTSIRISGSGDAAVYAKSSLEVKISGSGSVTYRGNPGSITQQISGSGSVSPAR